MNTKSKQTIFLLIFLILEMILFLGINSNSPTKTEVIISFIPATIVLAVILLIIYREVKEKV